MKSWEFSWMCRCSLSSNSMCVCVRLGLRDSQLSALCRFLSDVSGWGTVYQRNTCANLSAHGADWHSVCPRLVGNQRERERLRGKAWEKKKPMMVGKERMSLHVDTLGRLVMFFFFLSLSLNSRTTGPRSSYKVRLSFCTGSKVSFIFDGVLCS